MIRLLYDLFFVWDMITVISWRNNSFFWSGFDSLSCKLLLHFLSLWMRPLTMWVKIVATGIDWRCLFATCLLKKNDTRIKTHAFYLHEEGIHDMLLRFIWMLWLFHACYVWCVEVVSKHSFDAALKTILCLRPLSRSYVGIRWCLSNLWVCFYISWSISNEETYNIV